MLKTSNTKSTKLRKGVVRVGDDSKAGRGRSELDGIGMDNDEVGKKGQKTSKNLSKFKKTVGSDFLIPGA